jgi:hypothetical protein
MKVFDLNGELVLPSFGNGKIKIKEFSLQAKIWDSLEGRYLDNSWKDKIIVQNKKHLINFIKKEKAIVYNTSTHETYSIDNLPKRLA